MNTILERLFKLSLTPLVWTTLIVGLLFVIITITCAFLVGFILYPICAIFYPESITGVLKK